MIPESWVIKLGVLAALIAILAGCLLYAHHKGAESQQIADSRVIATLRAQVDDDASAMRGVNAKLADAKQEAARQKNYADAAISYLQKQGKAQAAQTKKWQAKLQAAEKSKGCGAQLQANLCESVQDY